MGMLRDGLLARAGKDSKAEMPFLDHLEELRWRILWCILAVVVGFVVGLLIFTSMDVMQLLTAPAQRIFGSEWRMQGLAPTDPFFIMIKISLTIGLILAFPIIVYQIWSFMAPALEKHEKRAIVPALYMGLVLFLAGVAMAYFIALPISLRFLVGIGTEWLESAYRATDYIGFVVKLLLAFGVLFELPVVILVLSALGLVTPAFLRAKRRHAFVLIAVLAALLSPGDVISVTVIMMAPLYLLYEGSIFISVMMWRKRDAREHKIEEASAPAEAVAATPYNHGDPARDPADPEPSAPDGEE